MADKPLVLIVDDEAVLTAALAHLLGRQGDIEVVTADDGQQGLQLAIERKPALVMLDVMMPQMDGYTACRSIRQAWADHPGLIWLVTGRSSGADVDQAKQAGADRLVPKPFGARQIVDEVKQALSLSNSVAGAPGT